MDVSKLSNRITSSVSGCELGSFLVHFFSASKRWAGHRSRRSCTTSWKLFSLRFYWGDIGTHAKHLAGDRVGDAVAQVDERAQDLLVVRRTCWYG